MKNLILVAAILLVVASSCNNDSQQNYDYPDTEESIPVESAPSKSLKLVNGAALNDTVTLPSGLKIIITKKGDGHNSQAGKKVKVHYSGFLEDGKPFDSSVDRGQPIEFLIGKGEVIKGWDEGLSLLKEGSTARLIIPADLAYGKAGYEGLIPPNSTLIFDVGLLDVE